MDSYNKMGHTTYFNFDIEFEITTKISCHKYTTLYCTYTKKRRNHKGVNKNIGNNKYNTQFIYGASTATWSYRPRNNIGNKYGKE